LPYLHPLFIIPNLINHVSPTTHPNQPTILVLISTTHPPGSPIYQIFLWPLIIFFPTSFITHYSLILLYPLLLPISTSLHTTPYILLSHFLLNPNVSTLHPSYNFLYHPHSFAPTHHQHLNSPATLTIHLNPCLHHIILHISSLLLPSSSTLRPPLFTLINNIATQHQHSYSSQSSSPSHNMHKSSLLQLSPTSTLQFTNLRLHHLTLFTSSSPRTIPSHVTISPNS